MAGNKNSGRTVDVLMNEAIARAEKSLAKKMAPIIEEQFKEGTGPKDLKGGLAHIVRVHSNDS